MIRASLLFVFLFLTNTCGLTAQDKKEEPSKELLARVGNVADKDLEKAVKTYSWIQDSYPSAHTQVEIVQDLAYLKKSLPGRKLGKDEEERIRTKIERGIESATLIFKVIVTTEADLLEKIGTTPEKKAFLEKQFKENTERHMKAFNEEVLASRKAGWKLPEKKPVK